MIAAHLFGVTVTLWEFFWWILGAICGAAIMFGAVIRAHAKRGGDGNGR